jgi:hypothetical protein
LKASFVIKFGSSDASFVIKIGSGDVIYYKYVSC